MILRIKSLLKLYRISIDLELYKHREALLANLSSTIVSSIPNVYIPGVQLFLDISVLNKISQQCNETTPLEEWIDIAIILTEYNPENEKLLEIKKEIQEQISKNKEKPSPLNNNQDNKHGGINIFSLILYLSILIDILLLLNLYLLTCS